MSDDIISFIENRFQKHIRGHQVLEAQAGIEVEFPEGLDPRLEQALHDAGIFSLYAHQAEAFKSVSDGLDCVIVSKTASGKTLAFLLPILNEYLKAAAPFSVLLLYPTKALSRDQEGNLGRLIQAVKSKRALGTYDGDTPQEERAKLAKSADFIITNPDMLHNAVLPNHNRKWRDFLSRLRYIVVDEVHTYRGAFGSHVANVFRRLLRVCDIHGSEPVFVCSSATVGNPAGHVEALFGRPFQVIDKDGSPRPRRDLYLVNPPVSMSHGGALYRKGPGSVSLPVLVEAAKAGVRTICFCRARQEVERLYRSVCDRNPELKDIVKPYRGGLLPNERRQLERDLFDGKIKAIITTNALELGIDIGDLDLCILSGHPGSMASFWQQAGRVGRKRNGAVIVYVAKETPVDQYLVHHADFITSAPVEEAWLNADNPYIILQHLPCAAHEHPLRAVEPLFKARVYEQSVDVLKEIKTVVPYKEFYRYALEDYPARGVNLRGMTDYNVEIVCGSEVIGELDPIGARGTLYKDAIYQHLGRKYMSMDLDLEKKLCMVEPVDVDYYTEAHWEKRIIQDAVDVQKNFHDHEVQFGYVQVNKQPRLYKKIRERSYENIGYGPITLPPFEYETTGLCLRPSVGWQELISERDKRYIGAALYGLAFIMKRVAPSLCMGDVKDIDTDVSLAENRGEEGVGMENEGQGVSVVGWNSALYLYDTIEGGVGYGEKIFEKLEDVLMLCLQIIEECECESGCPSCVPTIPPGIEDEALNQLLVESNASVVCTRAFIVHLLTGSIIIPEIKLEKKAISVEINPPGIDVEAVKERERLSRAAAILQRKREREH